MTDEDTQLTKTQVLGMFLLGLCSWAVLLGAGYAAVKDVRDGLIISVCGGIGAGILTRWLIHINDRK